MWIILIGVTVRYEQPGAQLELELGVARIALLVPVFTHTPKEAHLVGTHYTIESFNGDTWTALTGVFLADVL